jgi:hypothetical protein
MACNITVRRDEPLHYGEDKRHVTPIGLVFCMEIDVNETSFIAREQFQAFCSSMRALGI